MEKWGKQQKDFKTIYVFTVTPQCLVRVLPGPYDFVSIDIEGKSIDTLALFPELRTLGVKLICVEAPEERDREKVQHIMNAWGYKFLARTPENVLYRMN
jgi:hypothetical protein